METIINNPGRGSGEGSNTGMVMGVIVALVLVVLFFVYALPAIRGNQNGEDNGSIDVNLKLPSNSNDTSSGSSSNGGAY